MEENDFIIEENELTTYDYMSNGYYFEYFVGFEVASLIGYKNTTQVIQKNVSKSNQLIFNDYPGVKEPKLEPKTILITRDGAIEILIKTRKRISPDVLYILKKFNIDTTNRKCLTKEQQTLTSIANTFKTEKFEDQYKIGKYYLDLYFPEYKIVVECDENGHADRKPENERERMDFVNKKLDIDDSNWIRFNPDEHDFDMSKVIGRVYRKINYIKEKTNKNIDGVDYKKLEEERIKLEEEKIKLEEERIKNEQKLQEERLKLEQERIKLEESKDEEEYWPPLNIEVTTGKFTAPPKEFLLKKLIKYNISDIAKRYNISTNPVSKWLKQYEININDFKKDKTPTKEELLEEFKDKTQIEVAKHYDVSVHIVRKWMKKYDIDLKKLKTENYTPISKQRLVKLLSEFPEDEAAKQLGISLFTMNKFIHMHNIDRMPPKSELENLIRTKSRDDIAKFYKTTRTTLRKWLQTYDLDDIKRSTIGRSITVIDDNNNKKYYSSIAELCKELHISHSTLYEYADTGESYNGNMFMFHDIYAD
jgi:transposase-like protein/very-short-patch-repair endonuclease